MTRGAAETILRQYQPGILPSGWSRLVGQVVHRADGVALVVFSGFGLTVEVKTMESPCRGRTCWIEITRRDGALSYDDLKEVLVRLYQYSARRREMYSIFLEAKQERKLCGPLFTFTVDGSAGTNLS